MSAADAIVLASEELVIAARDAEWQRVPALLLARRVLLQDLERRASRELDIRRLEAVRARYWNRIGYSRRCAASRIPHRPHWQCPYG